MSQEQITAVFAVVAAVVGGIAVGGAGGAILALRAYARGVEAVLGSPVLMTSLKGAFASQPIDLQKAEKDTADLVEAAANSGTTTADTGKVG